MATNSKKGKVMKSFFFLDEREYKEFINAIENNNTDLIMDVLYRIFKDKDFEDV